MRTNKTLRIASVLLIAVLMTACVIGGTLAKYTASISTATATARVAKWDVKYNGGNFEDNVTFSLFDTIKDTDGSAETDVTGANVIAPGTKGQFEFTVTNASEVAATINITLNLAKTNSTSIKASADPEAANAEIPIEFSLTGEEDSWTSTLTADNSAVDLPAGTGSKTVTIYWRWAYAGDDAIDTAFGKVGTDTVTVSADITVTQKD